MPSHQNESFKYSSQPHSAPETKRTEKIHRPDGLGPDAPLTLMSDPRVIRGNTHSLARKITKSHSKLSPTVQPNLRNIRTDTYTTNSRPTYSYEVKSFSSNEIDVSNYLVEQKSSFVEKKDIVNQTDEFSGRPQTPDFVPRKTGIDRCTQVDDVNELFDFDLEVVPILEVIVRKTIEQAVCELNMEYELVSLDAAAQGFHAANDLESEWMRSKEVEVIKESIKTKVLIQALELKKQNETATKTLIAGLQMSRQISQQITESAFEDNFRRVLWTDPDVVLAETEILPTIISNVIERVNVYSAAQDVIDDILLESQDLYLRFPNQLPAQHREPITLQLTFRTENSKEDIDINNSDEAAEKIGDGSPSPVVLSFSIGPTTDSIIILERVIQRELTRLKTVSDSASSEDGQISNVPPQLASLPSYVKLYDRFTALLLSISGSPVRDIAHDASLLNFPLPQTICFDITY